VDGLPGGLFQVDPFDGSNDGREGGESIVRRLSAAG
jgi:hypothetical protein